MDPISLFISQSIATYAIEKGLDLILKNKEDFIDRLYKVIEKTKKEFESKYDIKESWDKRSFFRSKALMEELIKFRFFGKEGYKFNENIFQEELLKHPNIINPSSQELDAFMQIFDLEVKADEKLKTLEIEAFHKEEIFEISKKLNNLINDLQSTFKETINLLEGEYKSELDECLVEIKAFKPNSALIRITGIENRINFNSKYTSNHLKANLFYIKGICFEMLEEIDEARECIIKAYNHDPQNLTYLQRACYTYLNLNDKKYKDLIIRLEIADEYNPYLWAVKALLAGDKILSFVNDDVPKNVVIKSDFKRLIINKLLKSVNNELHEILRTLKEDKQDELPEIITFDNLKHWTYKFNLSFNIYLQLNPIMLFEKAGISEDGLYTYKLADKILCAIKSSEVEVKYNDLRFLFYWIESELFEKLDTIANLRIVYNTLSNKSNYLTFLYLNALHKHGFIEETLNAINSLGEGIDKHFICLKAYCLVYTNDFSGYNESLETFISLISEVKGPNVLEILNLLNPAQDISEYLEGIDEHLSKKSYSKSEYSILLTTYLNSLKSKSTKDLYISNLKKIIPSLEDEQYLNFFIAQIYYNYGEYRSCLEFLRSYIDFNKESRDLMLYIQSLYSLKDQDQLELLKLLKNWRENFSFNNFLLLKEIELRRDLEDWIEIEIIAKHGLTSLPSNEGYLTTYILAIDANDKEQDIETFAKSIKDFKFKSTENALLVTKVLFRRKHFDIALSIIYDKAINELDSIARQNYFALTIHLPENYIKQYDTVQEGRYVKFKINNKEHIFPVNEITLAQHPIVKESINRKVTESFTIQSSVSRKLQTVTIQRIMDKYLALHDEILLEIKNPLSSLPFEQIEFKSNDLKDFERAFVENFGGQEEERQKHQEQNLKDYYTYNISFTELVLGNFNNDYLSAYYTLTAPNKNGFTITPLKYYTQEISFNNSSIVIDFSTGLLLHELSKELNLNFDHFIVPNSFISILDSLILEAEHEPQSKFSVLIVQGKMIPRFLPDDFTEKRITFLREIKAWFSNHITIEIPLEKLDVTRSLHEDIKNNRILSYFIDNITLAQRENYLMLTDDTFFYKFLSPNNGKLISSEVYLNKAFPQQQEEIYDYLLQKRYIGISINDTILNAAYFNQYKPSKKHIYNTALVNLSLKENFNSQNIFICVIFLKGLALNGSISEEKYLMDATALFVHLLRSFPSSEPAKALTRLIYKEFYLLTKYLVLTLRALKDATNII